MNGATLSDALSVHALSDALTAAAYYSIPLSLLVFVRRRKTQGFHRVFVCFILFILLCGTGHLLHIANYLFPTAAVRAADETVRVFTAIVSAATAVLLWRMVPSALRIPTVSELEAANKEILHLAHHDPLTGLANRKLFDMRIDRALADAKAEGRRLSVFFMDLDRFKAINDTYGHDVGDELLKAAAERISRCVRSDDTISRFGGDEFIVLLEHADKAETERVARMLLASFGDPFHIGGHEIRCTPSVGISVFPDDGDAASILIKRADQAMYKAKEKGKFNFQFFTEAMGKQYTNDLIVENELRRAIQDGQLTLHYQPQWNVRRRRVESVEALVRWNHPSKGLVPPNDFVPLAEATGLILPLGQWVLDEACRQAKTWNDRGFDIAVAVNVSNLQLITDAFVDTVESALGTSGLEARRLTLELTESLAVMNMKETVAKLEKLVAQGVSVSVDDFGTGYSSLSYLSALPIRELKIDKVFIDEIYEGPKREIVSAITSIAHSMNIRVIAEGVEDERQFDIVRALGIDVAQGYYVGAPAKAEEVEMRLALFDRPLVPN